MAGDSTVDARRPTGAAHPSSTTSLDSKLLLFVRVESEVEGGAMVVGSRTVGGNYSSCGRNKKNRAEGSE